MSDREHLLEVLYEINDENDYETEDALIDDGLLSSLEILSIVSAIDNEFGVTIRVAELEPENFNSVDAMLELIAQKRNGR